MDERSHCNYLPGLEVNFLRTFLVQTGCLSGTANGYWPTRVDQFHSGIVQFPMTEGLESLETEAFVVGPPHRKSLVGGSQWFRAAGSDGPGRLLESGESGLGFFQSDGW